MKVRTITVAEALAYTALGANVVPVSSITKHPPVLWKRFQTERSDDLIEEWFGTGQYRGLGIVTGSISGIIDLDIDSRPALDHWTGVLGADVLNAAPHYRSPKAATLGDGIGHYWFTIPPGAIIRTTGHHDRDTDMHWDLKAEKAITVVPPTAGYEWVREPWS